MCHFQGTGQDDLAFEAQVRQAKRGEGDAAELGRVRGAGGLANGFEGALAMAEFLAHYESPGFFVERSLKLAAGLAFGALGMSLGLLGLVADQGFFLAAFGRAIAEVGDIIIVGGNIRGYTRTMTTTIVLESRKDK